jgi:hypothetical protein
MRLICSFLSNMAHLDLTQYVVPFPVPSTLAATFLAEDARWRADMIHIDAAHEYPDVVQDIKVGCAVHGSVRARLCIRAHPVGMQRH